MKLSLFKIITRTGGRVWYKYVHVGQGGNSQGGDCSAEYKYQPALKCAKQASPCGYKPPPKRPPDPPPPKKPFPWRKMMAVIASTAAIGGMYRYYVYRVELNEAMKQTEVWRPKPKVQSPFYPSDLPPCVQYLIVGTGAAGWAAYNSIMKHDDKAKVFMITQDDAIPYDRVPLSKEMWHNADPPDPKWINYIRDGKRRSLEVATKDMFTDPVNFYYNTKGPAVSLARGWTVTKVDADRHCAYVHTLCGDQPIYYERCLLAPGCKTIKLDMFTKASKSIRDKVMTLRSLRDFELGYRTVRNIKHLTIIGGGPLATELAWFIGNWNRDRPVDDPELQIVQLVKDKAIMGNILPDYLGEWAENRIKEQGVCIHKNTQVYDAFEDKQTKKLTLTLSNGQCLQTDFVIQAIGVEPCEELAHTSQLELDKVNRGFLVNTELMARTHLYVAGDAASFYDPWKNKRLRIEHNANAIEEGEIAGQNMAGDWEICVSEPKFTLDLGHDLNIEVVGEVDSCLSTIALFKKCPDKDGPGVYREGWQPDAAVGKFGAEVPCYVRDNTNREKFKRGIVFYIRDETVVGMLFWNFPPVEDRADVVTEMLRARPSYKEIDLLAELLEFPNKTCIDPKNPEEEEERICFTKEALANY